MVFFFWLLRFVFFDGGGRIAGTALVKKTLCVKENANGGEVIIKIAKKKGNKNKKKDPLENNER